MKMLKRFFAGIMIMGMFLVTAPPIGVHAATPDIVIASKEDKVPIYQAGQSQKWTLIVTNQSEKEFSQVMIEPILGEENDAWPFQTDFQNYRQDIGTLQAGESVEVTFDFVQREDVPTTRYTIPFVVSVDGTVMTVQKFHIKTTEKSAEKQEENGNHEVSAVPMDAGGISNGGAFYSNAGTDGTTSIPRVIVTGFTTDPAEVQAGSDFTLTIHLRNTSKETKVKNLLFDLSAPAEGSDEQTTAPAFLPSSGSSSIYLESIAANGTADISIPLNAKADLLQKPYSIEVSMKYEDAKAEQIEASSSISIPVKQKARFEFSEFEVSPESIAVGEETNVMTNLYNLGRIKLYNVKAVFEGTCIEREEIFVGNVESGATASIDAMLEGKKSTKESAKVTMTLNYEDEAGNVSQEKKDIVLKVSEHAEKESTVSASAKEEKGGFPILLVVGVFLVIAIVMIVVVLKKKSRNKQRFSEEEALLDELDRSSEDEQ